MHSLDDRDGVLPHRTANVDHHRRRIAQPHGAHGPLGCVFGVPDVGNADRRAFLCGDDDVVEILRSIDAAERAQEKLAFALLDRAAGNFHVLGDDGFAHLGHRQPVPVELLDIDDDVDLACAPSRDAHLADAVDRLNPAGDLLISQTLVKLRRLIESDDTMSDIT